MGHGNSGMTKKKEVLSEFFVNFFHVFRMADLLSNCSNLDITATTTFHEENIVESIIETVIDKLFELLVKKFPSLNK